VIRETHELLTARRNIIQPVLKIYIKCLIGFRSKERLEKELLKFGIGISEIKQGMIEFQNITEDQLLELKTIFFDLGFDVVDDESSKMLDQISELIEENIENAVKDYSVSLDAKIKGMNEEITKVFSQVHGVSLSQYITVRQVEHIKGNLLYEDNNLRDIADLFHYKSEAHLKRTFKDVTGLTPSYYKEIKRKRLVVRAEIFLN